jgi:hypothetical protein
MKPQWPTAPKTRNVLIALRGGYKLTPVSALRVCNVFAISQEVGRLKKLGWDVRGKMIRTSGGSHVKEYSL